MRTEHSYHDLFRPLEVPFEPTILLSKIGFHNIAKEVGMRQDTGSMVFNRLANRAFWSKNVAEEKFVTGSRHADDTFIDLRILRELDIKYIPGVGKAGKVILEHCQTMLDEVIAGPEPSDEVAEAPPAP